VCKDLGMILSVIILPAAPKSACAERR